MSKFLFDVQQKNRLQQKGLLKRFSIICYGHQDSIEEMRSQKAEKFRELKTKKGTREYEEWFLTYKPELLKEMKRTKLKKTKQTNQKSVKNKSRKLKKSLKTKGIFDFDFKLKNDPYKKNKK
jgi:hypothetical protein